MTTPGTISIDFETHLIAPGLLAPPPVCLSAHGAGIDRLLLSTKRDEQEVCARLTHWLMQCRLVGANVAYDFGVLCQWRPDFFPLVFRAYDEGRIVDVQIDQMLIDIARGQRGGFYVDSTGKTVLRTYSLAALARYYLGKDRDAQKSGPDAWRLRYSELDGVAARDYPKEARDYAIEDAVDALAVHESQRAAHPEFLRDSAAQARAAWGLHLMSAWGFRTDPARVAQVEDLANRRIRALEERLVPAGLVRQDGTRDTKAAKARLVDAYAAQGKEFPRTKTGLKKEWLIEIGALDAEEAEDYAAADYASLERVACEDSGDDLLELYAERTTLITIRDSQCPALMRGATSAINPRYNVLVDSGRTSCSKGKPTDPTYGFGVQNPARKFELDGVEQAIGIRECIVPREGSLFGVVDFPGLELHTGAQCCIDLTGGSRLGDMLNAGVDPHLAHGARILGIDYADALARKKEKEVKDARQLAKVPNFGNPGGLGAEGLTRYARKSFGLRIGVEQARALKRTWLEEQPEWAAYFARIREACGEGEIIDQLEQLRSGRIRGRLRYTEACNTYFQGLGADGAKAAVYEVARACYSGPGSACYGGRPSIFAHDEIVAEYDADVAAEAVEEQARIMDRACNRFVPDVPIESEPTLATCWSKGIEAKRDAAGRLVAWSPS